MLVKGTFPVTFETKGFVLLASLAGLVLIGSTTADPAQAQERTAGTAASPVPQQRYPLNQPRVPVSQGLPRGQFPPAGSGFRIQDGPGQFANNASGGGNPIPGNGSIQKEGGVHGKPQLVESTKIIAKVGAETIFLGDIIGQVNQVIEAANQEAPESVKKQQREMMIKSLLPQIVDQKLLYVDIVQGLPKEADVDDIKTKIGEQFDISALPALLARENVETANELDKNLRRYGTSLLQTKNAWIENQFVGYFSKEKVETPEVNVKELLSYYQEHLDEYQVKARVKWKQLVVRNAKFSNREAARVALAEMGNEVIFGARFEAVAERSSQGFKASKGGVYDWTNRGSLAETAVDKAIFSVQLNRLSDIIETRNGFAIVFVTDREDAHYEKFEMVQGEIKSKILNAKRKILIEKYVSSLKENIPHSTIYDDDRIGASHQSARPATDVNSLRSP